MKRILILMCFLITLTACISKTSDSIASECENHSAEIASLSSNEEKNKTAQISLCDYISKNELDAAQIYGITENRYLITCCKDNKYSLQIVDLTGEPVPEPILSDTSPICSSNGFWVLHSDKDNGMELNLKNERRYCFDMLYLYNYDFEETGKADVSGLGMVSGFDVDIPEQCIYYTANDIEDEGEFHRLKRIKSNGESELLYEIKYTFDSDYWLSIMHEIKYCKDEILFLCAVSPAADGSDGSVSGFGNLKNDSETPEYIYRNDDCNYEIETFDDGAIIHDGGMLYGIAPSGIVYYFKNGEQHEIQLNNPYETPFVYTSQTGEYFATVLHGKNEDDSDIYRITIYDSNGTVLKTEDYSFESAGVLCNVCINEYSKTAYFSTVVKGGNLEWHEFSF